MPENTTPVKPRRRRTSLRDRIIWIVIVTLLVYILLDSLVGGLAWYALLDLIYEKFELSPAMDFILEMYTGTITSVILLFAICMIFKKNRPIWKSFTHKDEHNNLRTLGLGLALGFLTNFACILAALIHGDIKLYFDMSWSMVPVMLFAFISTFIQSASEEMWCRGFMYERMNVHYPLWVAILVNGSIFGLLHIFNDGVTILAIADIVICGISYSLLRWYTGSMWAAMGIHTAWNFTQNFIFGLPNSGLVSEVSAFRLDAMNANSNLIYDYGFGVEGALPAVLVDLLLGALIIYAAKRDGRLGELLMSVEKRERLAAETQDANNVE